MEQDAHGGHSHGEAGGHGMIVWGDETIYFSHLAMFKPLHGDQVVLEVELPGDVMKRYGEDRKKHPESTFYSFSPVPFVMDDLFPSGDEGPRVTSIVGSLFRDQFEFLSGDEVEEHLVAEDVTATIKGVLVRRALVPFHKRPPRLEYSLFGKEGELYLVHVINAPPDFDQIIAVDSLGPPLPGDDLAAGVPLGIPKRPDSVETRLGENAEATGEVLVGGKKQAVTLTTGGEIYLATADFAK